jgi:hypothetical protein
MVMTDQEIAQLSARLMWACATSENHGLASSRSPAYVAAETAFVAVVREVYGVSESLAGTVRDLLAEYGPDDALSGTSGRGVASYVQFAVQAALESDCERMSYPHR